MSVPDKLFEDSEKSAVTCIMVFEAHKAHTENTKTWFGYWKEDGYIKVRPYGRIDYRHLYQDKIKKFGWKVILEKRSRWFSVLKC